jgi:hypothetical protein
MRTLQKYSPNSRVDHLVVVVVAAAAVDSTFKQEGMDTIMSSSD